MLIFNDIYKINKNIKNSTNSNLAPPKKKIKIKNNSIDLKEETQNNTFNKKMIHKQKYNNK